MENHASTELLTVPHPMTRIKSQHDILLDRLLNWVDISGTALN